MIVIVFNSTALGREVYGKGKHDLPKDVADKLINKGLAKKAGAILEVRTVKTVKKKDEVEHTDAKRTVKQRRKRSRSKNPSKGKSLKR